MGSWTGILLAVLLTACIAAGVMAFYPWLASEMNQGKQIFTAEEWEQSTGAADDMEEYDYETGSYDSAMSRDYDYYVDNGGYASYGAHVSYRGDEVWVLPGYGRVQAALGLITLCASVLVAVSAAVLAAVRPLRMTEFALFKVPFELMFFAGLMILGGSIGSGMGPGMAAASLSGETMAVLTTDYYHMNTETAQVTMMALNYFAWLFMGLIFFWMAETSMSFFTIGPIRWFKERTLTGKLARALRRAASRTCRELEQIDFNEKSSRSILKLVGINFILLTVLCSLWFYGIFGLLVYSAVLYIVLQKAYGRVREKYQNLLKVTNELAEGNLDAEITEDLGVFEPFREEIGKIQSGFKKAVEAEVKSQRMKTELITNVSHDLKTPLTAIITYVNLLKQPGITEQEKEEYVQVLDRKSLRLKALIEDLFEVSKANSQTMKLNLMDVDVVSLMKQVKLELSDQLSDSGIDFRFQLPENRVMLTLDSEKTYRIFENLLVNIARHGMQGTRAYVTIEETGSAKEEENGKISENRACRENRGEVRISMKNISAAELPEDAEELTGRFVRGDQSRNTEGSGLGLAIAKSFTELQNGSFQVETEADLFKAVIVWKK
ncbi:MAG: HAMP domain-containing histidine kinase [Clostridium sp.]|nr:HAMP domain-containing histidine kinase [Clostridium sp.]